MSKDKEAGCIFDSETINDGVHLNYIHENENPVNDFGSKVYSI